MSKKERMACEIQIFCFSTLSLQINTFDIGSSNRPIIFHASVQYKLLRSTNFRPKISMNLYASSEMKSPTKFTNNNALASQATKNKNIAVPSSILSPQKDQKHSSNRNLSSLILMASPTKPSPPTQILKTSAKGRYQSRGDSPESMVEMMALSLSAGVFMKSTTKFVKGIIGVQNEDVSPDKQKNNFSPSQQKKNLLRQKEGSKQPCTKNQLSPQKIALSQDAKFIKPGEVSIIYPSKEKIQRISRGQSNKKLTESPKERTSTQKLQQTLSRNRIDTERSINASKNQSRSKSRSRSGSVERFARKKEKTRQLKFMEKKQERSQTSINLLEPLPPKKSVPAANQNMIDKRSLIEAKSADNKKTQKEEIICPSIKQNNAAKTDKRIETSPSIVSNLSEEPNAPAKRELFKHIFTLSSGQLPLQTPVKPQQAIVRTDSNKSTSDDQTALSKQAMNQLKPQHQPKVSTIKEQQTSDILAKNTAAKSKPTTLAFQKSVKQQVSTYVHENPTEVVVCGEAAFNNDNSKFAKNQSTKAFVNSGVPKPNMNKNVKMEMRIEDSSQIQAKRNTQRKQQTSKNIPLETIPSSSSALEEKKSVQSYSSIVKKKSIKSQPKEEIPSNGLNDEKSLSNKLIADKTETISAKNIKKSFVLSQVITKMYIKTLVNALALTKEVSKRIILTKREASILISQAANFYRNLQRKNLRICLDQMKKISLCHPINKTPTITLSNSKVSASNIVFRIIQTKQRQNYQQLKLMSMISQHLPTLAERQAKIIENNRNILSSSISQMTKIMKNYHKNKIRHAFNRILLSSIIQKKTAPASLLVSARSPSKQMHPSRDYSVQKKTLCQAKEAVQTDIYRIQSQIANKRRIFNIEKAKLLKKQEELSKKSTDLQRDVAEKRQRNNVLKGYIQQYVDSQVLDISLPNCEPFVGVLTNIYSTVFRSKEENVNIGEIIEKHCLLKEDLNPLIEQWNSLMLNISIKSELAKWQGSNKMPKSKELLLAQQDLIRKVLRSYVRERYLWQWVRVASETL